MVQKERKDKPVANLDETAISNNCYIILMEPEEYCNSKHSLYSH